MSLPISAEDQARVLVGILENPSPHGGKAYPLYGPVEFTYQGIADVLSRVLGIEIQYKQVSIETMLQMMASGGQKPPAEHTARALYGEFEQAPDRRAGDSFVIQHLREVAIDHQNRVFAGTNKETYIAVQTIYYFGFHLWRIWRGIPPAGDVGVTKRIAAGARTGRREALTRMEYSRFGAIDLLLWEQLVAYTGRRLALPAEGPMSSKYQKSTNMNSILDTRSASGALAAAEAPGFTPGATKSEKQATGTISLICVRPLLRCALEALPEVAGIGLAILYSLAAFGLGAALLFYTFTR